MYKNFVKNKIWTALLGLMLLIACQKKSIFNKVFDMALDPKIQQIKNNYEKDENSQYLGLQPQWAAADLYSDKNGFVLIPIGERLDLVALSIDPPAFIYQKTLPTGRKKERIRLLYDAFGMLQMALYEHEGRTDVYLLKAEQRYAFHHINSREQKYQSWKDFDFEDFEFVDVKDLNALSSIFLTREDLLYCTQLLQGIIKRFKDKTDAIGNDPQYLMPMPGYPFLMVLNNEGAKKNCEAAKEAANSILATPCPSNYPLAAAYLSYCDAVQPDCRTGDCEAPKPCPGDPVMDPSLAPTESGSIKGARFGEQARWGKDKITGIDGPKPHNGIDIKSPVNWNLYNMHEGKVSGIYQGKDFGNFLQIKSNFNGKPIEITYAHLNSIDVKVGQTLQQGQMIGLTGKTGNASGDKIIPHVHVEVWTDVNGQWKRVDPEPYLGTQFDDKGKPINQCKQKINIQLL